MLLQHGLTCRIHSTNVCRQRFCGTIKLQAASLCIVYLILQEQNLLFNVSNKIIHFLIL